MGSLFDRLLRYWLQVFTRAEHLRYVISFREVIEMETSDDASRRHQLNHNEQLRQTCDVAGCSKTFHRSDLLIRHKAK